MRIGVGLSIPELATRGGRFSPASLFTGGTVGAWYDPSDYSTLFQDSAGTTPVTAVEQPVGLMLDKSQGLVLGSELVTNGDFSGGTTGWTLGAGWAVSGGQLVATSVAFGVEAKQAIASLVSGSRYVVTFTVTVTSGTLKVNLGDLGVTATELLVSASGTYTYRPARNGAAQITFWAGSTFTGTIDNVSVKEIPGNHASQSTSTSRPVLRARYNLLTYSEQFDNAVWSKNAGAVTVTADTTGTTDPLGGNTADKIVETATTTNHRLTYNVVTNLVAGTTYQFSVYAKAAERQNILALCVIGGDYIVQNFNVSTGTVQSAQTVGTNLTAGTPTITAIGNGWYRCVLVINCVTSGSATLGWDINQDNTTSTSYLGDITKGVYLWGADLRTGSSAGTYQRIAAATDYATAGFLPYLAFDGTDDSFGTNSINFSATDKMSVCAGVTKLSDAALGMIIELSANANSNNGTFWIAGPAISGGGPQYGMVTRGNISASAAGYAPTTYSAPITNTVTTLFNLAGTTKAEVVIPRINGVVDQGEPDANALNNGGTFLSYPLYIGRRNNSTFPFNGRIYQLIVCGKELSASELASTEAYVNSKTGAY